MNASTQAAPGTINEPATLAGLMVDLCSRWRRGDETPVETYMVRHPELQDRKEDALALIYQEVVLRERAGQSPQLDEYQRRFPKWSARLAEQFEVHHALESADERTMDSAQSPRPGAQKSGTRIAGCEVMEVLGRGGMGVVYRAVQPELNRVVALKLVLASAHASPSALARIRAEGEAAARLQHPNIVQVFQVGEHDGAHCLVLEYVPGNTLSAELAGTPQPPLRAAATAETLARAMHYAHQHGVVHRDLKPGNILLAAEGTPKITDFGLAKLIREIDPELTRTGDILGTPSYMAPEQAGGAGSIGPAVDIYALGAILYEMLGGRPPFRGDTPQETLRQVVSEDAVPPSRLQPRVARDLETICLKCLEKDPAKRYASAEALADDLRCFIDGRPIRARRVGPIGGITRWAKRRPAVAALSAAIALLTIAGIVGLAISARNDRRLRMQSEESLGVARAAVDDMYTAVAEDLEGRAGMDAYQRSLLEKALRFYQGFALPRSDDPEVQYGAAAAGVRVGEILARLGRANDSEVAYKDALKVLEPLAQRFPAEARYHDTLATALARAGLLALSTARTTDAEANLRRAVTIRAKLNRDDPRDPRYRTGLAADHGHLSIVLRTTGRLKDAEIEARKSQELCAALVQDEPVPLHRRALASAHTNLGLLALQGGRLADADKEYQQAQELLETLVAESPRAEVLRAELAQVLINVGNLSVVNQRWADAEATLRRSAKFFDELSIEHPDIVGYRKGAAMVLLNLGELARVSGQHPEAADLLRQSVKLWDKLVKAEPKVTEYQVNLALALNNLGLAHRSLNHTSDAEVAIRRALRIREKLATDNPDQLELATQLGGVYGNLALLSEDRGDYQSALDWLTRADRVLGEVLKKAPQHAEARQFRSNNQTLREKIESGSP